MEEEEKEEEKSKGVRLAKIREDGRKEEKKEVKSDSDGGW